LHHLIIGFESFDVAVAVTFFGHALALGHEVVVPLLIAHRERKEVLMTNIRNNNPLHTKGSLHHCAGGFLIWKVVKGG
jgi:hypothetical protein